MLRANTTRIVAALLVIGVGAVTTRPAPSAATISEVARGYSFASTELVSVAEHGYQTQRTVAPHVEKLRSWMSGIGASISLGDVRGTGVAGDLCLVDPRTDTVTVQAAPESPGDPYEPFTLRPSGLEYDREAMAPTGCLLGDFDMDGRTDALVSFWGRSPVLYFRTGDESPDLARFTARDLVTPYERWYTDSVLSADLDGDGNLDVFVGNYFPDGSRLLDSDATSDPAFEMNDSMSNAHNGGRNRVFLGRPGGGFTDASSALTDDQSHAWTLAMGAHDFTGDGLPEVYIANDFGPDDFFLNRSSPGHLRFTELKGGADFSTPKSKVLGNDSFKGMGIDFGDINGDGLTDMFVSNISQRRGLMETNMAWLNTGGEFAPGQPAPFEERSEDVGIGRTGWAWDTKIADLQNDALPEILQTTGFAPGAMNAWPQVAELAMANDAVMRFDASWMQLTSGWGLSEDNRFVLFGATDDAEFVDVAKPLGMADELGLTRAIAVGDWTADGRLDFAVAGQWGPSQAYVNTGDAGSALDLRVVYATGETASGPAVVPYEDGQDAVRGAPAIGAQATVTLPDGRVVSAQSDGGNGHASGRSPDIHLGLGDFSPDQSLTVRLRWRDGAGLHTTEHQVQPGRYTIVLPRSGG